MLGRPGIRLLFFPTLPGPCLASLLGRIRMGLLIMSKGLRLGHSIRGKDKSCFHCCEEEVS